MAIKGPDSAKEFFVVSAVDENLNLINNNVSSLEQALSFKEVGKLFFLKKSQCLCVVLDAHHQNRQGTCAELLLFIFGTLFNKMEYPILKINN